MTAEGDARTGRSFSTLARGPFALFAGFLGAFLVGLSGLIFFPVAPGALLLKLGGVIILLAGISAVYRRPRMSSTWGTLFVILCAIGAGAGFLLLRSVLFVRPPFF